MSIFDKRAPCGGWKMPREVYLGGPNQHYVPEHAAIRVWKNTTVVPNPDCLETCSPPDPCEPTNVPPYARPSAEWCQDQNGAPGQEAALACCNAKAGPPDPLPSNTYVESNPAEYVNRAACRKIGFKNLYAMKAWHGKFGPTAAPTNGRIAQTRGNGSCPIRTPSLTPPTRKYLEISATATVGVTGYAPEGSEIGNGTASGSASSTSSVGRLTGLLTGACTASGTGGDFGWTSYSAADMKAMALNALAMGAFTVDGAIEKFINKAAEVIGSYPAESVTFSTDLSDAPSVTVDYNDYPSDPPLGKQHLISLTCDLSTGHYHYVQTIHGPRDGAANGGYFSDDEEEITFADNSCTYYRLIKQTYELQQVDTETNVTATYTTPYESHYTDGTVADVNSDTDDLLQEWVAALADDSRYPWRIDGKVTEGPLVTRNEAGPSAPVIYGVEGSYSVGDVPRPELSAGAVIGAPNPAGYEPHWDFRHEVWENYAMSPGLAGEQWRVKEYGQACPQEFSCATQWLNNRQSQFIPAGPFSAYCSLRNPTTFTTGGCPIIEFAGMLVKCLWCETIMFAAPSMNLARPCGTADRAAKKPLDCGTPEGVIRWDDVPCHCDDPEVTTGCESAPAPPSEYVWNDTSRKGEFVFKQWGFDFRDWAEAYNDRRMAWIRANGESENCPGATWEPHTTVRYREDATAWALGTDPILSGSLWLKAATVDELCIEHQPCAPNVAYSSPIEIGFGNAVQLDHPELVMDEAYGSLWVGRVQQWLIDPLWMAPGPRSEDIAKLCDEDCSGGVLPDDGSGLADDLSTLTCYYPYPPVVEARNSRPAGSPSFPADAIPAFCGDVVAGLNEAPPVTYHGSCYPPMNIVRVFDPSGCGSHAIYMTYAAYVPPWVTLIKMEGCIAAEGRFSEVYQTYRLNA